ncbi:MAG TPA: hypothetical protein VFI72_08245 [Candidatus Angelobacter sp.]|jgi:hypothetical protein|nr:hypothetical protein [Candidatus Angelobacter sp.]
MEMFLMGLCVSVFGLGVAVLAFGAATRQDSSAPAVKAAVPVMKEAPARFFSAGVVPAVPATPPQIPIEVLLQQIETHVRLEQAAAESFVEFPTHAVLHSKTTSAFVN